MPDKSPHERVLQAIGFEVLAILLSTPLFAWVMGTPWLQMGVLTMANSVIAVVWNVIFNAIFDRYANQHALHLRWAWRVAHAALFEGGLFLITVPLAALWLGISLVAAVMLDIGLLLFFLPYTYIYHWAYDSVRASVARSRCEF